MMSGNKTILGFYSVAPCAIAHSETPEAVRRRLAQHDVPKNTRAAKWCAGYGAVRLSNKPLTLVSRLPSEPGCKQPDGFN